MTKGFLWHEGSLERVCRVKLHYGKELAQGCLGIPLAALVMVVAYLSLATIVGTWFGIVWGAAIQARNWFLQ